MSTDTDDLRIAHERMARARTALKLTIGLVNDPAYEAEVRSFCLNVLERWMWKAEEAIRAERTFVALPPADPALMGGS